MATIAPPKAQANYLNIPPPPLPEWYLPKKTPGRNDDDSSTSSLPAEDAQSVVQTKIKVRRWSKHNIIETYLQDHTTPDNDTALAKLPPDPGDGSDERMRVRYTVERTTSKPVVTFASPAPDTSDVPPLAVYHICRICLRPRSTRYHCEHPIPINGVPPPPGICRRCRVSTVEEVAKTAMIVQECESNKMKLGLAAFIPEEDYVSNKEMKERRARKLLRSVRRQLAEDKSASESTDPVREIVYRHVRVRETTSDPLTQVKTSVESTAQDAIDAVSIRSQIGRTTIAVAPASKAAGPSSEKTQSVGVPASRAWASDAGFRQVGEGVISTAPARDGETTQQKTKITAYAGSVCIQPASAHAPSTAIARASATIVQPARAERSESEIRKIAREEIARYRQAERKMEAHSDPYGHGRMVPVERRIEKQADVVEPMPWARKSEAVEEIVLTRRQKVPKESSSQPVRISYRHKTMEASEPQPTRAASQRGEASSKAPAEVKAFSAARPKRSGLSAELDRYVEREYVVERISDADGKVNTSSWKPYPAKILEKKFESGWQAQPWNKIASESARSERRDWDVVAEKFSQVASSSQPRKSAQNRPRSVRSDIPKWDARTESGKATADPGCDWGADAKHREVPGWEDEGEGYIRREIWLPPTGDYEVIEVIEETEKPRRVRTADHGTSYFQRRPPTPDEEAMPNRILEIESDVVSGASKIRQPPQPDQWPRPASMKPSSHEAESNGGVASAWSSNYGTASDISYRRNDTHSQPVHGPPSLSERSTRIAQTSRTSDRRDYSEAAEKPSKDGDATPDRIGHAEKPTEPTRPRAFDLRWAATVNAAAAGAEATTEQRRPGKPGRANEADLDDSDEGSDKTRWPGYLSSKPGSRTGRSDAGTERRTKTSEAPVSERGSYRTRSERSPEREYIFTERIVEPAGRQWERERSRGAPSRRYVETTEYFSASRGSKAGSGFKSTAGSECEDHSRASTQPRSKPASQSTAAQPTSDTSRNQRTIYREVKAGEGSEHSSGRVRFASKVDVSPTPPDSEASSTQFRMIGARPSTKKKTAAQGECGEDLIAEYEERRGRSRARDRARPAAVEEEGAEYFYERKEVERSRSRCDGAEDGSDRKEGAQSRSREPKPIGWAFSESPSRELHGEVHAGEKEDGFGPYRPEMPRPDSTDLNSLAVGSGSVHGEEARAKHTVHGRWQEDLPVLEGVGW
ncbi:hypothetical protein LTR74_012058 [Friedmanniomyces endolithicus]|nr:hypothetical protein LTR74_012058 [Friedmanniomyces endolithicus]